MSGKRDTGGARQTAKLRRARARFMAELPAVYDVILERAKQGVPWAAKLVLEHVEQLEAAAAAEREGVITFTWSPPTEGAAEPAAAPPADEDDGTC